MFPLFVKDNNEQDSDVLKNTSEYGHHRWMTVRKRKNVTINVHQIREQRAKVTDKEKSTECKKRPFQKREKKSKRNK